MAVWLFMTLFVVIISQGIATAIVPNPTTPEQLAYKSDIENIVSRISPSTLFSESVSILLNPAARVFGLALESQAKGILPTPLALAQSLNLIWPHITTLFGLVAVCFGISYITFMRPRSAPDPPPSACSIPLPSRPSRGRWNFSDNR